MSSEVPPQESSLDPAPPLDCGSSLDTSSSSLLTPSLVTSSVPPWPEPVDGAQLLDNLLAQLRRFVVFGDWVAEALSLWILHTHAYRLRQVTIYSGIESPEKKCGKSTLLTVLSQFVNRPLSPPISVLRLLPRHRAAPTHPAHRRSRYQSARQRGSHWHPQRRLYQVHRFCLAHEL